MDDPMRREMVFYHPRVTNHIDNDPTPKDQAIYVPSISQNFAIDIYANKWKRALPEGIEGKDLNFLDPNNRLFRISHALSSAGQALGQTKPCIVTERDTKNTLIIGDSGGYQIASGRLHIHSDYDREKILRWLENTSDVAMTLDVPTGPLLRKGYKFKSHADCLKTTMDHLDFFHKNRRPGKVKFLNVLQGNSPAEADDWYDNVKTYPFEGWAFAGLLRHNMYELCRRLIIMMDEGQLQGKDWIHVLGTNELEVAVLLTAIQRAINRYANQNLRISYDTSTPFRLLAWRSVITLPNFDTKRMSVSTTQLPDGDEFIESKLRWPWPSALGDHMTLGDVFVQKGTFATSNIDTQSCQYLAHHSLSALCWAVSVANRVFDSETINHQYTYCRHVGAAVEAINSVLKTGTMSNLMRYRPVFAELRHSLSETGDEDRIL